MLQDKVTVWKLRDFERDNLEVLEGGKGIEVVTAIAQGGESLRGEKKKKSGISNPQPVNKFNKIHIVHGGLTG